MTDFRGVAPRRGDSLIILAEPAPRLNGWYEPRLYTYRGTGKDELTAWMDDAAAACPREDQKETPQ